MSLTFRSVPMVLFPDKRVGNGQFALMGGQHEGQRYIATYAAGLSFR